jgi:hypothetical protein
MNNNYFTYWYNVEVDHVENKDITVCFRKLYGWGSFIDFSFYSEIVFLI